MIKDRFNNTTNKFNFLLLLFLGLLCWETYSLEKRMDSQMSALVNQQKQIIEFYMMMQSFVDMAPSEMESIARQISRQEGIKLFKEFSDNLKKLNEKQPLQSPKS